MSTEIPVVYVIWGFLSYQGLLLTVATNDPYHLLILPFVGAVIGIGVNEYLTDVGNATLTVSIKTPDIDTEGSR